MCVWDGGKKRQNQSKPGGQLRRPAVVLDVPDSEEASMSQNVAGVEEMGLDFVT